MRVAMHAAHEDKFVSMTREMGTWVDHVLGRSFHKYCPDESWMPAVNFYEDDTRYYLVADLAGVEAEGIDVRPEDGNLVLSGYRQTPDVPKPSGNVRLHHMEIDHGHFCRSMEMPDDVDVDRVEAFYKSGLLWVELPKKS